MVEDCSDRYAETGIAVVTMITKLFRHGGAVDGFAVRAGRGVIPAYLFQMVYAAFVGWKLLIDFDDVHG